MAQSPEFVHGSPLLEGAYEFAAEAHVEAGTDLAHPVAVAELLAGREYREPVVAAALLHEVLEDTDTAPTEIGDRFGPEVEELVMTMTEDDSIAAYEARKAEHRARVAGDGTEAAAIYAADKLAKALQLDGRDQVAPPQLAHYRATLSELREAHPDLSLLSELDEALGSLDADREHTARR